MITDRELQMAATLTQEQVAALIVAIEQFDDLMGDSSGVAGLHLNGDLADWDWLQEDWLSAFAPAYAPLREINLARLAALDAAKNEAWPRLQDEAGQ